MIHVFLGPSLSPAHAHHYLDAVFKGPAARGSVQRAVAEGAKTIAIIDGFFHTVPTVTHKEILRALDQGIGVFGASSLGALRAAELERYGMVGVGRVFEAYRAGALTRDDEVAVTVGPAELGYPRLSEALVDIRATLEAWQVPGSIRSRIMTIAQNLHYPERSWPNIVRLARQKNIIIAEPPKKVSLKEDDARLLLETIAHQSLAA